MARKNKAFSFTIRRCNGNKACWCAVCGKHDWCMGTSYSLDGLISLLASRYPTLTLKPSIIL